jgi:hypothetical protein
MCATGATADPVQPDPGAVMYEILKASAWNRELHALVRAIRRLRARLEAFADRYPTLELAAGLVAGGMGRALAVEAAIEYLAGSEEQSVPQEAVRSLLWHLAAVADAMDGVAI